MIRPKLITSITFRCDPDDLARIRQLCEKKGVERSDLLRALLRDAVVREAGISAELQ